MGRGEGSRRGRQLAQVPEQAPPLTEEERVEQLIEGFRSRQHFNPLWVDSTVLVKSNIWDRVKGMLEASGWPRLLTLFSDADVQDTSEFLAVLSYSGHMDNQEFRFMFRGEGWECTMSKLRRVFGWPAGGAIFEPNRGNWAEAWSVLAPTRYNGGNSSPKDFPDPALFYLHQILSKTLFARKNADKVGQLEMSVLIMLARGERIHWGHYFMRHLTSLRANSPISCGGMVTYLLRKLHPGPVPEDHTILTGNYADWIWFRHGQHIQVTLDGEYQWRYYNDVALRPPPVASRPVGRPRGRDRQAQGRIVVYDPDQQPEPEQEPAHQHIPGYQHQSASVQEQLARQLTDTVFNSTRASILAGRQFDVMPAPPGWNMGDPIPPEYLQPRGPPGRR